MFVFSVISKRNVDFHSGHKHPDNKKTTIIFIRYVKKSKVPNS